MSATLLQRVSDHLALGSLTDGYAVKYFRWTDASDSGPTMLFRMAGTEGALSDFSVQYPDVQVTIIATPQTAVSASERCREILQYVRENYLIDGGLNIEPITSMSGPFELSDGRPWFQLEFRVIVDDH
tara:strand:+ start:1589 stop:1972 length:384 start_codon:yes stop_codon:yes gene_type:complete